MNESKRKYIEDFPKCKVEPLDESNKEYIGDFRSAEDSEKNYAEYSIGEYLVENAYNDQLNGKGTTYLFLDKKNKKTVAFFTISASSLMILLENGDDERDNSDIIIDNYCSIPSVKIDYFAVDVNYQNTFYEGMPVSAHIFNAVISILQKMSIEKVGFQAVYLYTLESSEGFYIRNGLSKISDTFVASEGLSIDDVDDLLYMFVHKQNIGGFKMI